MYASSHFRLKNMKILTEGFGVIKIIVYFKCTKSIKKIFSVQSVQR